MQNTLVDVIWPIRSEHTLVRNLVLAVAGSILLIASSKISVPFYPVPMTMQTLVVLVIGMTYGWKLGGATVLLYIAEGAAGLPVFSGTPEKGIGLAYITGTTGGYLLGFVFAVVLCGYLAGRGWGKTVSTTALAMVAGNLAIYIPGLLWLGFLLGWDQPIFEWGLLPFILGDIVKLLIALAILPVVWRLTGKLDTRDKS